MRTVLVLMACAMVCGMAGAASADPGKDESGKGRWGRGEYRENYRQDYAREYKQEFRQGGCKIERKWERDGAYKEEVKCDGKRR